MKFNPQQWSREILEFHRIKQQYGQGDILWLLDHWRYPFTESELAKFIIKVWSRYETSDSSYHV